MSNNNHQSQFATHPEAVGLFSSREAFEGCVKALLAAGFEREDLSVLSSHESLEAAESAGENWRDVLASIAGDIRFEAPLVASGAILLAGGPVAATLGAAIAAAVGAVAVRDLVGRVTSTPDTDDFARALGYGGAILWVRSDDPARLQTALDLLTVHGAENAHLHGAD
ncbi:MAG: hypothetical protein ACPGNT_01365 [Rhodospirillales bacterium]